jgi:hypothetical protein
MENADKGKGAAVEVGMTTFRFETQGLSFNLSRQTSRSGRPYDYPVASQRRKKKHAGEHIEEWLKNRSLDIIGGKSVGDEEE